MTGLVSHLIDSHRRLKKHRRRWLEQRHARNPRCHYCRNLTKLPAYGLRTQREMLEATLDHAVPQCEGGTDDPRNYRLACLTCNTLKADM